MSRLLRSGGLEVIDTGSGLEALQLVAQRRPALALLHLPLSDMDEDEVCQRINRNSRAAGTIVLQASASLDDVLVAAVIALLRLYRVERELVESRAHLGTFVSQVGDCAIFRVGLNGRASSWNEGVRRMLGYERGEFLGLPIAVLFERTDEEREITDHWLATATTTGSVSVDRWMLRKDAERFWSMCTLSAMHDSDGAVTSCMATVRDHRLRDHGEWKSAGEPLRENNDTLDQIVEERAAKLFRAYAGLQHAERMASLGTLSAGLGHDLGNLLLPVRLRIEAMENLDLTPLLAEHLVSIHAAVGHLQRLANGMRLLSQDPERARAGERTELTAWWIDVSAVLKNVLPFGVKFNASLPPGETWVSVSRAAMTQIVFNIVQNAGDALRQRGAGHVGVTARVVDDMVELTVADDGPGMADEVRHRCMEPFFSTKPRGISTGMGLALAYGLTRSAGGTIDVQSDAGRGTAFTLRFAKGASPEQVGTVCRKSVVRLRDPRMRAFVSQELRLNGFVTVEAEPSAEQHVSVWVLDEEEAGLAALPALDAARVILFGEPTDAPHSRVIGLGRSPKPAVIRETIQQVAAQGIASDVADGEHDFGA